MHYARTPLPAECAKLEAKGQRSLRSAQVGLAPSLLLLLLLLLSELVPECAAESPWGLPVIADGPASLAKVVMAELSSLKFEEKTWPGGTHSLHYHYLTLSEPGPGLPKFLAVGYVDDQPFIRYDSCRGKAEPQAPWMALVDSQYWETETQKQRAWEKVQQVEMWTVMGYHNQSGGIHSAQRMFGCEIQEDGRSSSFWQFGFDGQDHLSLDLETLSWVSAEPVAVRTKRWWEMERCYAEYDKAYLESLCLISLHRYLELGSQSLTRIEPPMVQVTKHTTQDGTMLRCWALGFYPPDISLSWWLGRKELVLETEHVETRPSGDGTYQTWTSVRVPAGKEAWYTCHVQHPGLKQRLTVAWDSSSIGNGNGNGILLGGIMVLVFVGLVAVIVILKKKYLQGGEDNLNSQSPERTEAAQTLC
ncbi:H-2 class I histocompatibility antigen, Q10 alpha chain-like [Ictidomys tridecemlineatus]|uniref:H-2 class I histocompatibility antigen, Q10 alpha chain-like n=1 Tax=Ictidomys tridecemlineatus TaxID=43179 RepID=I3NE43_ICTTR|nr:H-2 class I histocompatibility antigen, Q10 alpha chain-like [Ictidomys tridecemlineatus]KAG3265591.1 H-2 class I histocompatibility antigen, Q10 alpha chain-like [Ictidomys tridecemlineatus]